MYEVYVGKERKKKISAVLGLGRVLRCLLNVPLLRPLMKTVAVAVHGHGRDDACAHACMCVCVCVCVGLTYKTVLKMGYVSISPFRK